jgi:hypothetical protein
MADVSHCTLDFKLRGLYGMGGGGHIHRVKPQHRTAAWAAKTEWGPGDIILLSPWQFTGIGHFISHCYLNGGPMWHAIEAPSMPGSVWCQCGGIELFSGAQD